mmetsp:Transcript_11933/g.10303  ORF Transcript_11933/g.10303 Transcript_11933/m.10303 type:complete len:91 (-) Transcript_11933:703-975(-)
MVGYSLHSNYEEITQFVKSIMPAKITTDFKTQEKKKPVEELEKDGVNKFQLLRSMKQNGRYFLSKFEDFSQASEEYKKFMDKKTMLAVRE